MNTLSLFRRYFSFIGACLFRTVCVISMNSLFAGLLVKDSSLTRSALNLFQIIVKFGVIFDFDDSRSLLQEIKFYDRVCQVMEIRQSLFKISWVLKTFIMVCQNQVMQEDLSIYLKHVSFLIKFLRFHRIVSSVSYQFFTLKPPVTIKFQKNIRIQNIQKNRK